MAEESLQLRIEEVERQAREREEALRESEERFRILSEAVPSMVWVCRPDGFLLFLNRRWIDYTGQAPEEYEGYGWAETMHPDDRPRVLAQWEHCTRTGETYEGECRYRRHDGVYRWHYFRGVPRIEEDGTVTAWYGTSLDIQDRKVAEEALRESERRFKKMADTAPAVLWITEADGACSFLSRGWYELTGQTEEEALGYGWLEAAHPDDREQSGRIFQEANARREPFALDYRLRRADGEYRWAIDAGRPRFGPAGEFLGFIGSVIDVHERKQAEDTLRESEATLRAFYDSSPVCMGVTELTGDGDVLHIYDNPATCRFFGVEPGTTVGKRALADLGADPLATAHWREGYEASEATGEPAQLQHEYRTPDGPRWLAATVCPIGSGPSGRTRFCYVAEDVTDRKHAEETLREADRRKDEFLATLAHELRNPLAPISNALHVLKARCSSDPRVVWGQEVIERQLRQMARLLDDLLDVSRITRGKAELRKSRVTLTSVVDNAVETSRPLIEGGSHELTIALPDEIVCLEADPVRLAQVFSNLLNNAAKYTPDGGRIWLTAEQQGREAIVSVKDSGIGIVPEMLPHVFEMFSQAEPARERWRGGLGIGLALAKGLVEMHGGRIEARSGGPGTGSEFIVQLPVVVEKAADAAPRSAGDVQGGAPTRRVLIVDDLKDSADSLALMLKLLGHEAHTAYDGEEAVVAAEKLRPDVVLLDLGMPRMNGYDACRHIRQQPWGRDLFLVALTGWGQEDDRRRTREAGFDVHMIKPVDSAALIQVLAAAPSRL